MRGDRRAGIWGSWILGQERFQSLGISLMAGRRSCCILPDAGPRGTRMDYLPANTARWEEMPRFRNSSKISWATSAGKSSAFFRKRKTAWAVQAAGSRPQLQGKGDGTDSGWENSRQEQAVWGLVSSCEIPVELLCNSGPAQTFWVWQFLSIRQHYLWHMPVSSLIHRTGNLTPDHRLRFFVCVWFSLLGNVVVDLPA